MGEAVEFTLVFALAGEGHDPFLLSDAVVEAGFPDALIGTGASRLLSVELEAEGETAEAAILGAARRILAKLPAGTVLREVRPDLVSLADVAERLAVSRQSLQQREMPPPVSGGLYRIDEVAAALAGAAAPDAGRRRPRFRADLAAGWFRGGAGARRLNAKLALGVLDPRTLQDVP